MYLREFSIYKTLRGETIAQAQDLPLLDFSQLLSTQPALNMKLPWTAILRDQYTKLPPIESMNTDFRGKTVIVSGSNTGLGKESARHIARMMGDGPDAGRLILACRNVAKATDALNCMSITIPTSPLN